MEFSWNFEIHHIIVWLSPPLLLFPPMLVIEDPLFSGVNNDSLFSIHTWNKPLW
ncbi:rCG23949, isoform CRA_a [Rattus norvegicus]|uniref:RCG23949, isoform CRA_a n=1 Tax=Rattus norvegicus TaxID=10116 RepID=A6JWM5_RAT|nr:rCG23949, isoform CRA_a [Rattus norvegicus]